MIEVTGQVKSFMHYLEGVVKIHGVDKVAAAHILCKMILIPLFDTHGCPPPGAIVVLTHNV